MDSTHLGGNKVKHEDFCKIWDHKLTWTLEAVIEKIFILNKIIKKYIYYCPNVQEMAILVFSI